MDFKVLNIYSQNANPLIDNISPRLNKISFLRRAINSFNYYTLLINLFRFLNLILFNREKLPVSPWKFDFFANSYFQKQD